MENKFLVQQLREKIKNVLTPLIDNDYVYLDLPYYANIGDTLIWEGTKEFLNSLPYKCLYYASKDTFHYRKLASNVVILLNGGGNFGDLYRLHSEFRRKIIELYPNNKVIILPQTVYYEDASLIKGDADFYASHTNVKICAREQFSYDFLKEHFKNEVFLIPDMAFFLNLKKYKVAEETDRILYLKRMDKELVADTCDGSLIPVNAEVHDWPTCELQDKNPDYIEKLFYKSYRICRMLGCSDKVLASMENLKRYFYYRPTYVQIGISFLSPYHTIYTTRLHVLILGLLLDKEIYLINNTSGKVINYYNTWLSGLGKIKIL